MKIGLYNEFPTESLENIKFIDFPVDVTMASPDLETFRRNEAVVRKNFSQVGRIAYWPTLKKEEGYWISPFADEASLNNLFGEIESRENRESELAVMLDFEPPLLVNKQQMIKGLLGFKRKK